MAESMLLMLAFATLIANGQAITCYYRTGSSTTNPNGDFQRTCTASGSFCYSYTELGSSVSYGSCASSNVCTYPSCVYCTTDNCNTVTPSAISCFTRASFTKVGTPTPCHTGVTTCYTLHSASGYAGCGNCTTAESTNYGCTQCTGNYCNTLTPSYISCYARSTATSSSSDGILTSCPTGASSCYSFSNGEAGCGSCTYSSSLDYGCSSCLSNFCNTRGSTKPKTVVTDTFSCYYSNGDMLHSSRVKKECPSSTSCYEYTVTYGGLANWFYAGCGSFTCTGFYYTNCRTCSTSYCNSAAAGYRISLRSAAAACCAILLLVMKLP